jgi:UDP-glucose 4-epimerase
VYWKTYGVPAVRLRFFSVYGPRMRPDLMLAVAMQAMYDGRVFDVHGDGEQTRDFTYVTDAVDVTVLAAERGSPGDLYNVGGGSSVWVNRALDILTEVAGMQLTRRHVERQPFDHRRAGASITRARMQLGWEPRTSLQEGLERQWHWFLETQEQKTKA